MELRFNYLITIFICCLFCKGTNSDAVQLNSSNIDSILASNELVLVNFYADWCRFSNLLAPIWDEAAKSVAAEFADRAVLAKVDCDQEGAIATRYHITKYPTLKIFRNGQVTKREYRGQRSSEALVSYVKKQMEDPIKEITSLEDIQPHLRAVLGRFSSKDTPEYKTFRKAGTMLKDDCNFFYMPRDDGVTIEFVTKKEATPYVGDFTVSALTQFLGPLCVPMVREITFENAEEFSEEGLPFLILFHTPNDHKSKQLFSNLVARELKDEKQNVNFLTADGEKFSHPLHHLGKSVQDLPLIAIDSFRHMYLFPKFEDMHIPGRVKQFLQDLYSGKLHREFHYGPDSTVKTDGSSPPIATSPPESTFKKLAPSKNRYTLLRDEL